MRHHRLNTACLALFGHLETLTFVELVGVGASCLGLSLSLRLFLILTVFHNAGSLMPLEF